MFAATFTHARVQKIKDKIPKVFGKDCRSNANEVNVVARMTRSTLNAREYRITLVSIEKSWSTRL